MTHCCYPRLLCCLIFIGWGAAVAAGQQIGQFDKEPRSEADEAYIFTPDGFDTVGEARHAEGEDRGRVVVTVLSDVTGEPTFCRANVVGSDGHFYQPPSDAYTPHAMNQPWPEGRGNRPTKAPIRYFGRFFYNAGSFTVDVPPGPVRIEVWKGFEHRPATVTTLVAPRGEQHVELVLEHAVQMAELGYYSGDPHLHFERMSDEEDALLFDLLEAEDIRYGTALAYNNDTTRYSGSMTALEFPQRRLGADSIATRGSYHLLSGQEYRSSVYGHMNLFLRDRLALEGADLDINGWPVFAVVAEETREHGGKSVYAHGGYAQEIYADVVQGAIDGVELFQFGIYRGIGLEAWYRILNTGFRLSAHGASDFPACRKLGDSRTYVHHDGPPSFPQWLDGMAAGRSFVSSGPLLLLEVDGQMPGETIALEGSESGRLPVRIRVRSEVAPVTHVQLIVGGRVLQQLEVPASSGRGAWIELNHTVEVAESTWIAARAFSRAPGGAPDADAHTNPVFVAMDGRAPYVAEDVDWLIGQIDEQIAFHEKRIFERQHDVVAYFQRSREILTELKARGGRRIDEDLASTAGDSANETTLESFVEPIPPREPDEALAMFETIDGFRVEQVACESLVSDPVVAAFDEDGRLYVGELIDYPFKPSDGGFPLGLVRRLEDVDGDGVFDQGTVFANELLWPTGICPWRGGVYIAAAPDIWYLKDTNGDGAADERRRVFTGFGTQNQQGMLNNLVLNVDGWVYGSASVNGGVIRGADDPDSEGVDVAGRGFRFHPDTLEFETIPGNAQFGCSFDDWGRRFTCSESTPFMQAIFPPRYLGRNPHAGFVQQIQNIAAGDTRVYRTSPVEPWRLIRSERRAASGWRGADDPSVSHDLITSAAGVTVYRGAAYPESFRGNIFIGASQTNVIHRRALEGDGIVQSAVRADEGTEFVRTADTWFRPVNFVHAPDGTLYVLDLYRETIESVHIPLDVVEHLDLSSGRNRGRIYRLAPEEFESPPPPNLSAASVAELVEHLESPHGWWRDTAGRLLIERGDATAIPLLRELLARTESSLARCHALWMLDVLQRVEAAELVDALADNEPGLRVAALKIADQYLGLDAQPELIAALPRLVDDPNEWVRMQLAFTLGESDDLQAFAALARLLRRDVGNAWIRAAVDSSLADHAGRMFVELAGDAAFAGDSQGASYLSSLVGMIGRRNDPQEVQQALDIIAGADALGGDGRRRQLLIQLGGAVRGAGGNLLASTDLPDSARAFLNQQMQWASDTAPAAAAGASDRVAALRMLAWGDASGARAALTAGLDRAAPEGVQRAALDMAAAIGDEGFAEPIIAAWSELTPAVAERAIELLLARREWIVPLLDAVRSGQIAATALPATRQQMLLEHDDAGIRELAVAVLNSATPRAAVVQDYQVVEQLTGDVARGAKLFGEHCLACHVYGGHGHEIGPNLAVTERHTVGGLLQEILDPNRSVNPAFMEYVVIDAQGRTTTGMLAGQSATHVTLRRAKGEESTVARDQIDVMRNSGRSLMPEGLEKELDHQQMADLIAYVLDIRYDRARTSTLPGLIEPEPEDPSPQARVLRQLDHSLSTYTSREAWRRRCDEIRGGFLRAAQLERLVAGRRAPAISHTRRVYDGYTVENVALETWPGFFLTGNLYRPANAAREVPAVLCPHGHFEEGRYRPDQQIRCAQLARMGAVVLSYSMVGWQDSGQTTHDDPLVLALQTYNSLRAVDWLIESGKVDADRIAVTGASGGGTQTLYLALVDERVKAAAPAVIVYPWSWFSPACNCEGGLPVMREANTNAIEVAAALAPRPQLIMSCGKLRAGNPAPDPTADFPEVGWPFVRAMYARSGAPDAAQLAHFADEAHDYGPSKRAALYAFVEEHLQLDSVPEDLERITIEPPEMLRAIDAAHPLPSHALHGAEAIAAAWRQLQAAATEVTEAN